MTTATTVDQLFARPVRTRPADWRRAWGVQQVKFRRRWYWSGREPVCRRSLLGSLSVEAKGIAIK
jgi:hypothetical protein